MGNNDPVSIADEVPFEIPESWEWCRLYNLTVKDVKRGKSPTYNDTGSALVFAQKCNVKSGGIDMSLAKFLDEKVIGKYPEEEFMRDCDIVVNSTGTGTMGRIGLFRDSDNPTGLPIVPDSHVTIVRLNQAISVAYLMCCLQYYQPYLEEHGEGSTNQKELKPDTIKNLFIPLPPESEQQRIAEMVGSLEPYISEYRRKDSQLSDLNKDFPNQLKKSILQLAVQGKLVDQDPNDESASVLLERIRAEKERLIAEGKIKRDKNESVIYRRDNSHYEMLNGVEHCIDDEIPFDIPFSWSWIRIGSLTSIISDGTHKTPHYVDSGVPFLSVQNISKGYFDFSKLKHITLQEHNKLIERVRPQRDDILFCRIGTLGKAIKIDIDLEFSIFVSLGLLRPVIANIADYIVMAINSPLGDKWIQDNRVGGGTHTYKINLVDIPNMLIPLPPLHEQHRLIDKTKELIAIVDTL